MGITVWTQRRAMAVPDVAEPAIVVAEPPSGSPQGSSMPSAVRAVLSDATVAESKRPSPAAAAEEPREVEAAPQPDEAPFTITALCLPGAVLLADALTRQSKPLLTDLVRAVAGDFTARPALLEFNWPIAGMPGSSATALAAFVDKQRSDFATGRVLAASALAERVSHLEAVVLVPESLAEPEQKRKLWQRILSDWQ